MKFLLDQNVEGRILTFLSGQGHDATRVGVDYPPGLPDEDVLATAHAEQRILITNDRDFGELIFRHRLPHSGVIYLRFPLDSTAEQKIANLANLLATRSTDLGQFLVATPRGVRIRT